MGCGLAGGIVIFFTSLIFRHAQNYVACGLSNKTIEVLNKLNEVSQPDDFRCYWWDYGSRCWFYGGARIFTSPAHQTFDNYLTQEISFSKSN